MPEQTREALLLNCAEALAEYLHFGQVDKQGHPYVCHVQRVYKACYQLSTEQRVAAILHDTIEDSEGKFTFEIALSVFGQKIALLLDALTRRKSEESYAAYIKRLARTPEAVPIKLADIADHLDPERGTIPGSLRERYLDAREWLTEYA